MSQDTVVNDKPNSCWIWCKAKEIIEEFNGFNIVPKAIAVKKTFLLFFHLIIHPPPSFDIHVLCLSPRYYEIHFPFLPLAIQVLSPKSKTYILKRASVGKAHIKLRIWGTNGKMLHIFKSLLSPYTENGWKGGDSLLLKKDGFGSQPFSRLQYYFCLRVVQMKQMGTEINVILQRKGRRFWRMGNLFLQHQVNSCLLYTSPSPRDA